MRTRGESRTRTTLLAASAALLLALCACSSDGDQKSDKSGPGTKEATESIETDAAIDKVSGELDDAAGARLLAGLTKVVDRWFDGAYAGDYPRSDFESAFADFTKDAKALALKQPGIMSNAKIGADLKSVEITQRLVRVDVLAPKGKRVAGATVRFRLGIALTGAGERTELVAGRLLLTPTKAGWKIFGFDVRRGEGGS